MLEYLSERGKKWVRTLPPLVKAHFDNFYNMYDKDTNPGGLINMGTAESHLVNREVCDLLRKAADRMDLTGYNLHYNKFEGSDEFRSAIAAHWQKVIFGADSDVVLTKDNVATCAGCTVALETLATLLAEPGDVFLIPAPYYSSFVDDINERAGVIAVGVPCDETLDRNAFEAAYERVTAEGRRVRAVLFSSPNNPIGIVYKEDAIRHVIDFAMAHDLEIISDEIYAQTVFDPEAHYVSTLKLVPAGYRHRVHVTSSFAKDFVLSGFRTGMLLLLQPRHHSGLRLHHLLLLCLLPYPVPAEGVAAVPGAGGRYGSVPPTAQDRLRDHDQGPCGHRRAHHEGTGRHLHHGRLLRLHGQAGVCRGACAVAEDLQRPDDQRVPRPAVRL